MWLTVWTIGNGGTSNHEGYHEIPDDYDDDSIGEILESKLSPMCYGVRSINWERIPRLPNDVLDEEIEKARCKILSANRQIERLEQMKKEPESIFCSHGLYTTSRPIQWRHTKGWTAAVKETGICPTCSKPVRGYEEAHPTWKHCDFKDAEEYRHRILAGSIGLEGKWSPWTMGKPTEVSMHSQYEYRRRAEPKYKEPTNGL